MGCFLECGAERRQALVHESETRVVCPRELARLSHLSLQTVQDELAKLEAADLISSRDNGYQRFYRANSRHPLYATLRRLVVRAVVHRLPRPRARGQRRLARR